MAWRDDACALRNNGTHYVSTISLSECGSTVELGNDTVTFSNDIIVFKTSHDVPDIDTDNEITHGEDYETVIPVKCVYPRLSNVSSSYIPVKQNVRFVERTHGVLDVTMEQYEDGSFTSPIDQSEYPVMVPLNDDVFIRLKMDADRNDIRVKTDRCIATSTPSPADKKWIPLITNGCPRDDVHLLSKLNSSDVRFSFKAFDFRHDSSGFIYLHCEVSVCEMVDTTCNMGCGTRAKRSVHIQQKSHLISTGPFLVQERQVNREDHGFIPIMIAVVCFIAAMVSTILAVIGWTRRRDCR
ncbi:hypothetical protein ACF0H5_006083 [Mactra antiquata]